MFVLVLLLVLEKASVAKPIAKERSNPFW